MDNEDLHQSSGVRKSIRLSDNVIGIDHIAVAVSDMTSALNFASNILGCSVVEERETKGRVSGMKSAVLQLGGLAIVLIEGTSNESQVAQFVTAHGPGVQHVALLVRNLTSAVAELESNGMDFSTPRLDGGGLSQIFSTRNRATGLMIELIERNNSEGFSDDNIQRLFQSLEDRNSY